MLYRHDYEYLLRVIQRHEFRLIREFLLKYRPHDPNAINENAFAKDLETLYTIFATVDADKFMAVGDVTERMKNPIIKALMENPAVHSADVRTRLHAAEKRIKELQESVRNYEDQIRQYEEQIRHHEDKIRQYEKKLKEDNALAVELKEMVKNADARLMDMNERLQAQGAELLETRRRLDEARQLLDEILSSKGWLWLTRFRRAKQLLHVGSRNHSS